MLTPDALAKKVGRKVLFVGTEAFNWAVADFGKAARNARTLGFDSICVKRADGGRKWYVNAGHLALERQACLTEGVGFIPFSYCYGPAFGNGQIDIEVAVAKEMAAASDGLVCMDLEVEWNGRVSSAVYLAAALRNFPGDIILSTWADPVQQNWDGIVKALNPVVSAWGPQQYTNWLGNQEGQFAADGVDVRKLFPAIDVADLFGGANNPLGVMQQAVARGRGSIWVWEYGIAISNPNLMKSITALVGSYTPSAPVTTTPVALPSPQHTVTISKGSYRIVSGDSLTAIAAKLKIGNWFADLYQYNRTLLDNTAKANGQPSSNGGSLIYPGTVLAYLSSAVNR